MLGVKEVQKVPEREKQIPLPLTVIPCVPYGKEKMQGQTRKMQCFTKGAYAGGIHPKDQERSVF